MADTDRASEGESADGGGPSKANEDAHQIAAHIAQAFRDAAVSTEVLDPGPTATGFGTLVQRDRIVLALALTLMIAVTWSYLLWLSVDMGMGGMDMTGFRMIPAGLGLMMPADAPWRAMEFAFVFAMWAVMMVGMMTPSAMPMIFMYARVGRHAESQHTPLVATVWFATGYFLIWVAFALLATLVQWALERGAMLDAAMTSTNNILGGLLFVAAGSYQWTRLKDACLTQCQMPFAFVMRHGGFHRDAPGSVLLGLRYGAYCVGCCGALMALLFVGGVMNPLWIVLLALLVIMEKVTSFGRQIATLAGIVLVAAGAWLLLMAML
jgi:predicted metal-binding membrane protein